MLVPWTEAVAFVRTGVQPPGAVFGACCMCAALLWLLLATVLCCSVVPCHLVWKHTVMFVEIPRGRLNYSGSVSMGQHGSVLYEECNRVCHALDQLKAICGV